LKYFRFVVFLVTALLFGQTPKYTADGFRVAREGYPFIFPRDHGNHPDFKTEWWYVTGHLVNKANGNRYGYQLTFFRQASPKNKWRGNSSWQSDQIYMAHAAITDESKKTFTHEEKLNRGGILANSKIGDLDVFNESWFLKRLTNGEFDLQMSVKNMELRLKLKPLTSLVTFGKDGVSKKGDDPTASSHYLTYPRMQSEGSIRLSDGSSVEVEGLSWMDHEISSNQLASNQSGWDWAGIQLHNGTSIMFYRLRLADGTQDINSMAYYVDNLGKMIKSTKVFNIKILSTWISSITKIEYPSTLQLTIDNDIYIIEPKLKNQELNSKTSGGLSYWEGSCRVSDPSGKTIGNAYLELTGYTRRNN
jgi:predicted secreted hydrolase